jgi:hypothetical protein
MLIQEARWFADHLANMAAETVFPMCNVGSSTRAFRTLQQPWIDEIIFRPASERGTVKHLDLKADEGVDIIGDLTHPAFLEKVSSMGFNSVFCSNLLEHVVPRSEICHALVEMLPSGGLLFLSVPYNYPYHEDPIDTGFRPSVAELASLFPNTEIVVSDIVAGDTLPKLRRAEPLSLLFTLSRPLTPWYKPSLWWRTKGYLPWFFRPVTATCAILRKR